MFPPDSFATQDQLRRGLIQDPSGGLPVHPVQLYSAAAAAIAAVALARMLGRPHPAGAVFAGFLVFYGALRLAAAIVRVEVLPSMTVFSVAFVVVGTVLLWRVSNGHRSTVI